MSSNVHAVSSGFGFKNDIVVLMNMLWRELVFGGHLFALGSVSVVMACSIVFMIPVSWDILFVTYLLFYAIYLYDYTQGASSDEATNSSRAKYLLCKNKSKCTVIITSLVLFTIMMVFTSIIITAIGMSILVLGLLYGSHFKKLTKKIPAFKNVFVSIVWAFMAIFAFIYYSVPITYGAIMLALFVFIRMMNIQILFDVRDMEGDRKDGLLTVPAIIGEKYPFILKLINYVSIGFVAGCIVLGLLPVFTAAIVPMAYYGKRYINRVVRSRKEYTSYIFAAFEPIMWSVFIFAGKYVAMLSVF
nr:UbiA family prenyltransferase [uncultured Methanolobus sp.]